jgi:hypothetical protein
VFGVVQPVFKGKIIRLPAKAGIENQTSSPKPILDTKFL